MYAEPKDTGSIPAAVIAFQMEAKSEKFPWVEIFVQVKDPWVVLISSLLLHRAYSPGAASACKTPIEFEF